MKKRRPYVYTGNSKRLVDEILYRVNEYYEKNEYPIHSLLETDLYKLSMGQFVLHRFSKTQVKVEFRCRSNVKIGFLKSLIDKCLDHLCDLTYNEKEIDYIRNSPYLKWLSSDFIDFLRMFQLYRDQIHTEVDAEGQLVMYAEGAWRDVIHFEVACLAIVEECYMRWLLMRKYSSDDIAKMFDARSKELNEKIEFLNRLNEKHPFTISEFGLRRRTSANWEEEVVSRMKEKCRPFIGTSNVFLAANYNLMPCGTMAHELYMGLQGENYNLRDVQRETWKQWREEFGRKNGILLTDIFGARACFRDMDEDVANSFTGFRHDSGNPIQWGEELISRLNQLGIDPKTKTFVWSDCLDMKRIEMIARRFSERVRVSFGVGTNLVNCIPGIEPLSIVMKMTYSNGRPVLKLSDDEGKGMCPSKALIEYAREIYQFEPVI